MRRREFITFAGGAAAWPVAARAQQSGKPKRIGVMGAMPADSPMVHGFVAAFEATLKKLGWRVGENVVVDYRWNGTTPEAMLANAAELFARAPDLMVARTTLALQVAERTTKEIPIVFLAVSDPIEQGLVGNAAHPGGNVTGFASWEFSVGGKFVDFLQQAQPQLARVAYIYYPIGSPQYRYLMPTIEAGARRLGLDFVSVSIQAQTDIEPALARLGEVANTGFIIGQDSFLAQHRKQVVELAARYRLAAVYGNEEFAEAGGLIVYSVNQEETYRGVAIYADRILKGAAPGDLPVQLPARFILTINLAAARTLNLEFPLGLMIRADEVIE